MVQRTTELVYKTTGASQARGEVISLSDALTQQRQRVADLAAVQQQAIGGQQRLGAATSAVAEKVTAATAALVPMANGVNAIAAAAPRATDSLIRMAAAGERASVMSAAVNTMFVGGAASMIAGSLAAVAFTGEALKAADAYSELQSKIKVYTDSGYQAAAVERQLEESSKATRVSISAETDLYARLSPAVKDLGRTQDDAVKATDLVTKAFAVQGMTAQQSMSSAVKFGQVLSSGMFNGSALSSIGQEAPQLLRYIAQNLELNGKIGVSLAQLKNLSSANKVTSAEVLNALMRAGPQIEKDFVATPHTAQQEWSALKEEILRGVGQLTQASGAQQAVVSWLADLSNRADEFRKKMLFDPHGMDGLKEGGAFIGEALGSISSLGEVAVHHFDDIVTAGQAVIALKLGDVMAGWFAAAATGAQKIGPALRAMADNAKWQVGAGSNPVAADAATALRASADAAAQRSQQLEQDAAVRAAQVTAQRAAAERALQQVQEARSAEAELRARAEGILTQQQTEAILAQAAAERRLAEAEVERAALEDEAARRQSARAAATQAGQASQALSTAGVGPAGAYYAKQAQADAAAATRYSDEQLSARIQKLQQIEQAERSAADIAANAARTRSAAETAAAAQIAQAEALSGQAKRAEAEASVLVTQADRAEAQAKAAGVAAASAEAAAVARDAAAKEAEAIVTAEVTAAEVAQNFAMTLAVGLYTAMGGAVGIAALALGGLIFAVWKAEEAHRAELAAMRDSVVVSGQLAAITGQMAGQSVAAANALYEHAKALRDDAAAARQNAEANLAAARARREKIEADLTNPHVMMGMGAAGPGATQGMVANLMAAQRQEKDLQSVVDAGRNDEWATNMAMTIGNIRNQATQASAIVDKLHDAGNRLSDAERRTLQARLDGYKASSAREVDDYNQMAAAQQRAINSAKTRPERDRLGRGLTLIAQNLDAANELGKVAGEVLTKAAGVSTTAKGGAKGGRGGSPAIGKAALETALSDLEQLATFSDGMNKVRGDADKFAVKDGKVQDTTTGQPFVARTAEEAKAAADYLKITREIEGANQKAWEKVPGLAGKSKEQLLAAANAMFEYRMATSDGARAADQWADKEAEMTGESRTLVKAQREINEIRSKDPNITDAMAAALMHYYEVMDRAKKAQEALSRVQPIVAEVLKHQEQLHPTEPTTYDVNYNKDRYDAAAAERQLDADLVAMRTEALEKIRKKAVDDGLTGETLEKRIATDTAAYDVDVALLTADKKRDIHAKELAEEDQATKDSIARRRDQENQLVDNIDTAMHDLVFGGNPADIGKKFGMDLLNSIYAELIGNPMKLMIHNALNSITGNADGNQTGGFWGSLFNKGKDKLGVGSAGSTEAAAAPLTTAITTGATTGAATISTSLTTAATAGGTAIATAFTAAGAAVAAQIAAAMQSGGGGGGGGGFMSFFSNADGSFGGSGGVDVLGGGGGDGGDVMLGNAKGTDYWRGGRTRVNEEGGEIIDLPRGSRILPHDVSMAMASAPTYVSAPTYISAPAQPSSPPAVHIHNETSTQVQAETSIGSDGALHVNLYEQGFRPGLKASARSGDLGRAMMAARSPLTRRA